MLIVCKCKNIFWGEKLRRGSAPGSDVVTFSRHLGGSRGMPHWNILILSSLLFINGTIRIVGEAEGLWWRNFSPTPSPTGKNPASDVIQLY